MYEEVAELNYQPTACAQEYRMVVVRKNISKEKGEVRLHDEVRFFFYLTNDWVSDPNEIVFVANDRCDQENLLAQLHSGVRALRAPVDTLVSNGAYMVMTALAWSLKAWWALLLPEAPGRWQERHRAQKRWVLRLEFKTFVNAFVRIPCQLVRTGRRLVYRLLSWNPPCRSSSGWWTGCAAEGGLPRSRRPDAPIRAGSKRDPAGRRKAHGNAHNAMRNNCSTGAERGQSVFIGMARKPVPAQETSLV